MALTPPDQHQVEINGIRMCWFDWPAAADADPSAPTILLTHANGFHARCWDRVVEHLGPHRVVAVDQRGHGRSEKRGPYEWASYGQDLAAFVRALGIEGAVGVGHSMGGHATVQAAVAAPHAFSRLVLLDPVILPPETYRHERAFASAAEHPVSKRKNRWRDWREMVERFRDRVPFSLWAPGVLEDYARWGLEPDDGDGYRLACPPLVEAANYTMSTGFDIYGLVEQVTQPVVLLRARARGPDTDAMDFTGSPTWSQLASRFQTVEDVHLADLTHFIPMQAPELTARRIIAAAR